MRLSMRGALVTMVLAGLVVGGVLLAGPPADEHLALRRFLSERGLSVFSSSDAPTPPGTLVLLSDVRTPGQAEALLRWVERGGRLVVADPRSPVLGLLGVDVGDPIGLFGTVTMSPGCPAPEVVGVEEIVADAGGVSVVPAGPDAVACFLRPGGPSVVFVDRGEGRVAILGGGSFLTNDLLDEGDNAILALRVVGDEGPVVFGPAAPPGARGPGLWVLLPAPARLLVVEVAIGGMLFALARARRLGRPVIEEPIAPIPGGELVRATAALYRRSRAAAFCGRLLRRSAFERLSRRVGGSPDLSDRGFADLVAGSSGLPRDRVEVALVGPEPENDGELLALANDLSDITRDVEAARR